jgi:hypothetical protein
LFGLLALGAFVSLFWTQVTDVLVPPCDHPPQLAPDTEPSTAVAVAALFERELLYCPEVPSGLVGIGAELYWGSDGVNSLLYLPMEPGTDVSLRNYVADDFAIPAPGGRPPVRFQMAGRPSYRNQAPEGAAYYTLLLGAPQSSAASINVALNGRVGADGIEQRDFINDMVDLWDRARSNTDEGYRTVRVRFGITPRRWEDDVTEHIYMSELSSAAYVGDVEVPSPSVYRTLAGPLGSSIWVAGIVTGTLPALTWHPGSPEGPAVEPAWTQRWADGETGRLMYSFAFPPGVGETGFASFWSDESNASQPPDAVFGPLSFGPAE